MATLAYPSGDAFLPETMHIGLDPNVLFSRAPLTKSTRRLSLTGSPWRMVLTFGYAKGADAESEAAEREAFWNSVGGQENLVSLYHFKRPAPRGTMRGSPTVASTAAKGATSIAITTTAGATVKKGDMLGLGSGGQLVQVKADATANGSGAITVDIVPMLRAQVASATAVVWDKPTAPFMIAAPGGVMVPYSGSFGEPFSVELLEAFA